MIGVGLVSEHQPIIPVAAVGADQAAPPATACRQWVVDLYCGASGTRPTARRTTIAVVRPGWRMLRTVSATLSPMAGRVAPTACSISPNEAPIHGYTGPVTATT